MKQTVERMKITKKIAAVEAASSRDTIRQKVDITNTTANLLQDTHGAQQSILSNQLHSVPSIRQQANTMHTASHIHPTNPSNNSTNNN